MSVFDAITTRRSIRQFLADPVPDAIVDEILGLAARAPSGQNMQPWLVHHVTGQARDALARKVSAAAKASERSDEYDYFPVELREPYLSRRREVGRDLFAIYGIDPRDKADRLSALLRNFDFFGAPVGLFFTMERDWGLGAWIDCGMFMMNVMTVARAFRLHTCPQQAWCEYGAPVRSVLGIPDSHVIISGMALGFADEAAPENALVTTRVAPAAFMTRHR